MNTAITMQSHAENYLDERRRFGYRLRSPGYALRSFARYVDGLGLDGALTVEVMAEWARRAKTHGDNPATRARRLKLLRPFARYLQQFDPRTEVPDNTPFGRVGQRLAPHIYSEQEIVDLLAAARRLGPVLRGATYEALFGLLASTGLRVSEAVHLMDADVELKSGLLTVRQTKFAKSRQVPLHPSTVAALRCYRGLRNLLVTVTEDTPLFVGTRGRRRGCALSLRQVHRVFQHLRDRMDWVNRGAHAAPRIHDLRHYADSRIMPSTNGNTLNSIALKASHPA
jgi:integrase